MCVCVCECVSIVEVWQLRLGRRYDARWCWRVALLVTCHPRNVKWCQRGACVVEARRSCDCVVCSYALAERRHWWHPLRVLCGVAIVVWCCWCIEAWTKCNLPGNPYFPCRAPDWWDNSALFASAVFCESVCVHLYHIRMIWGWGTCLLLIGVQPQLCAQCDYSLFLGGVGLSVYRIVYISIMQYLFAGYSHLNGTCRGCVLFVCSQIDLLFGLGGPQRRVYCFSCMVWLVGFAYELDLSLHLNIPWDRDVLHVDHYNDELLPYSLFLTTCTLNELCNCFTTNTVNILRNNCTCLNDILS